jgi:hypothetical protein
MSALLRVAELNAAYAATIDADGLEAWPDFFVEDCLYKITSAENHRRGYSAGIIYADSRAMLCDRITALRTANIYERQSYRHIVGLPVLGEAGADGIAAETPFLVCASCATARHPPFRLRRRRRLSHKFGGLDGWLWPNEKKGGAVTARTVAGDPDQDKIRRLRRV